MSDKPAKAPARTPTPKLGRPFGSTYAKKHELLEALQRVVYEKHGVQHWCPLSQMAVYAADPNPVQQIRDSDGKLVFTKSGDPVTLEVIDPIIRQRCLETIAKYVYPALKSVEMTPGNLGSGFTLEYSMVIDGSGADD